MPPVGMARLDREFSPQHEIMICALAVIVPGNDVAASKRKETYLNVGADCDRFDPFHLVVRFRFPSHGSALMFAARMILARRADSALMMAANRRACWPPAQIRSHRGGP